MSFYMLPTHSQKVNGVRYFWTFTAKFLNVNANWPLKFFERKIELNGNFSRTRTSLEIAHLATLVTRPFGLGPELESPKTSPKMADPKKPKARKEARPPTAFFSFL